MRYQQVYPIAIRIPVEARVAACAVEYHPLDLPKSAWTFPRTRDNDCPMGIIVRALQPELTCQAPDGHTVAKALSVPSDELHTVSSEAYRFIYDWDAGRITDLRVALGLS